MDTIPAIVIVVLLLTGLIIFLILRNRKDKEEFENELKNDYHKPGTVHDTDSNEQEKI